MYRNDLKPHMFTGTINPYDNLASRVAAKNFLQTGVRLKLHDKHVYEKRSYRAAMHRLEPAVYSNVMLVKRKSFQQPKLSSTTQPRPVII
jgi:hypothetical protein